MKKFNVRRAVIVLLLAVGTAALAFGAATVILAAKPISSAVSLEIGTNQYVMHIGDEADIDYRFEETTNRKYLKALQKLKEKKLVFSSSDENVVSVDGNGHFTAVGEGTAVITAAVSDLCEEITVTSYVRGEKIGFSESEYSLNCGEDIAAETVIEPADAVLFDEITYTSSDESVVRIDEEGHIYAGNPGQATVSVSADGLEGKALVNIYQPMTGMELTDIQDDQTITLERGSTYQFNISYYPENTTDDRTITWTLSDPSAGTIDENGLFTAVGRGAVTLTASCNGFEDSVSLYSKVTLTGIEISQESRDLVYPATDALSYTTIPEDITDELSVSWISENTGVVTVDENGNVASVGGGTADVVLNVNGFEKRCTYTVTVPITGVNISSGAIALYTGTSTQLAAAVVPSFTTEADKSICWTTDNAGVAQVDGNGVVTAVAPGTTVIHAIHGAFSASCSVSVADKPTWENVADGIIAFGKQYLGTRYVYGGNSLTGGIDCSAFTQKCFASQGISISRTSYTQVNQGSAVSLDPSEWRKGDLIFYSKNGKVYHVGIYIGDGQILQSSESQGGVCITAYNYNGMTPSHVRRYF